MVILHVNKYRNKGKKKNIQLTKHKLTNKRTNIYIMRKIRKIEENKYNHKKEPGYYEIILCTRK